MFCGFECLSKHLSGPQKPLGVEASSSINVRQQGQSVEARVHLSGTGNASLTVQTTTATEVSTATELSNHVGDTQQDDDDLEKDLEKLFEAECAKDEPATGQAMQPVLQDAVAEPEKSVSADAEACDGDKSKLEALQSMIQHMLKRPGTIDINRVMAEASALQAKAAPARRRISTKSAPEQSKGVAPEKTEPEQSSVTPEKTALEQSSSVAAEKTAPEQSSSVAREKTAPEQSSSVAPEKAPEQSSSVAPEKAPEQSSSVAPEKAAPEQSSMPPPVGPPKRKPSREEETEEERLAREAHNKYMRFYRSIRPFSGKPLIGGLIRVYLGCWV